MAWKSKSEGEPITLQASVVAPQAAFARRASDNTSQEGLPQGVAVFGVNNNNPLRLELSAPTLIRWEHTYAAADPTKDFNGIVRVSVQSDRLTTEDASHFTLGNWTYFPNPGIYMVRAIIVKAAFSSGTALLTGMKFEGVALEHAIALMTSLLPAFNELSTSVKLFAGDIPRRLAPRLPLGGGSLTAALRLHSFVLTLETDPGSPPTFNVTWGLGGAVHSLPYGQTIIVPPGIVAMGDLVAACDLADVFVGISSSYR